MFSRKILHRYKTPLLILLSVTLIVLGVILSGALSNKKTTTEQPPLVRSIAVKLSGAEQSAKYAGEVRGRYESQLAFQVSGKIIRRTWLCQRRKWRGCNAGAFNRRCRCRFGSRFGCRHSWHIDRWRRRGDCFLRRRRFSRGCGRGCGRLKPFMSACGAMHLPPARANGAVGHNIA